MWQMARSCWASNQKYKRRLQNLLCSLLNPPYSLNECWSLMYSWPEASILCRACRASQMECSKRVRDGFSAHLRITSCYNDNETTDSWRLARQFWEVYGEHPAVGLCVERICHGVLCSASSTKSVSKATPGALCSKLPSCCSWQKD